MRNVFCVWALCAMLFCVAPGLAGAAPQLNEEALRSVVISRLGPRMGRMPWLGNSCPTT